MSIAAEWDNGEKTAIRITFNGKFTWDEYAVFKGEMKALFDSVDHKVGIIVATENIGLPKDFLANLTRFSDASSFTHPNAGQMVIVVAEDNRFLKVMVNIYDSFNPGRIVTVPTLEKAREIAANHWSMKEEHDVSPV